MYGSCRLETDFNRLSCLTVLFVCIYTMLAVIITAVSITFSEIHINQLREYLHQAELNDLTHRHGLVIDGDNVILPKSAENQSRPKKYGQNMTIDDISGLMQVLLN